MAALTYLNTGYAILRGAENNVTLDDNLYPNIDGTGTRINSGAAKMAIIEIADSPVTRFPRLFISPESAVGGSNVGGGVRSIGLGEKFKVSKTGDTNTEITFANGQTLALAATFETRKCAVSSNAPVTVMVTLYS